MARLLHVGFACRMSPKQNSSDRHARMLHPQPFKNQVFGIALLSCPLRLRQGGKSNVLGEDQTKASCSSAQERVYDQHLSTSVWNTLPSWHDSRTRFTCARCSSLPLPTGLFKGVVDQISSKVRTKKVQDNSMVLPLQQRKIGARR